MGKVNAYTKTGSKSTAAVNLPKDIFEVSVKNHVLLGQAYRAYLAASRNAHATAKTRGMVSGSRRKHHRQKGTGMARAGTIQSPTRVGGGVAFGPTGKENYHLKLSLKAKHQAVRQALTLKAAAGDVTVLEAIETTDGKTKSIATLLQKLELKQRVLLVVEDKVPQLVRATRNLANVDLVSANYLNVYKILNADSVVITKTGLQKLQNWLGAHGE